MSKPNPLISQSNKNALRNPWVWGWLALVAVVLAVNVGMITTAVMTNPGLVEEDYYEKGRDHERNMLKRMAARSELGWDLGIEVPQSIRVGQPAVVRFTAVDKNGQPVSGADVLLKAYRPSDASADFGVPMKEIVPGQYDGFAEFPLKGMWELQATIVATGTDFTLNRRINVLGD